jgi:large subunit ribosomal protein L2
MKLIKLKPSTGGTRHQLNIKKNFLSKNNNIIKNFVFGTKKNAGKSSINGRTTVWHKGGGCKSKSRKLESIKNPTSSVVICTMYDPKRTSFVSLNFDLKTKKFFQNLSTLNVYSGSIISNKLDQNDLSLGDRVTIESIPPGSIVHSLAVNSKDSKTLFARSAGTFCQIIQKQVDSCKIKLPSGSVISVPINSLATLGSISNSQQNLTVVGKAGRNRLKGIRPTVRGIAMNPVDHPHGGRTNGGRPSVTPWGKPTKGKPTVKNKK